MRPRSPLRLVALALTLNLGCAGVEETRTELGFLCVEPDAEALLVTAQFAGCITPSCDTIQEASCQLEQTDAETIAVTGEAVIRSRQFGACDADCQIVTATCELPVEPGTYTIVGGGAPVVIDFPLSESACDQF